jgi:hypothetical protein
LSHTKKLEYIILFFSHNHRNIIIFIISHISLKYTLVNLYFRLGLRTLQNVFSAFCVEEIHLIETMDEFQRVDEAYEAKMLGFEIDCNDSKGLVGACHHVGEFFSTVKEDYKRSSSIYSANCNRGYNPSCFNLAKLYREDLVHCTLLTALT